MLEAEEKFIKVRAVLKYGGMMGLDTLWDSILLAKEVHGERRFHTDVGNECSLHVAR